MDPNRLGLLLLVEGIAATFDAVDGVAPRKHASIGSPRGLLPLRLRGKGSAGPLRIGVRIFPRDVHHWMIVFRHVVRRGLLSPRGLSELSILHHRDGILID